MTSVSIKPYNREPHAQNAYIVRVEGRHGTITSWHSNIGEAVTEAAIHVARCDDWREWERFAG